MSYFDQPWRKASHPRLDHDKVWKRAEAILWDARWQALPVEARRAYLIDLKPPSKAIATPQASTLLEKVPATAVQHLVEAGFARVDPGQGRKGAKVVALPATHDFSLRLRALHRYRLLGPTNRLLLTNYLKHAFHNQGESVLAKVLEVLNIDDRCRLEVGLERYVTTGQWPEWTLKAIDTKPAAAVLDGLLRADGPIRLTDLPSLVKGVEPTEIQEGLTDLIVYLVAFEDLEPETFEILVGMLPVVRDRQVLLSRSERPGALVVCEKPREIGPVGGLAINDLRVFLLELASETPRLKLDGSLYTKEEPRFMAALPPLAGWLESLLKFSPERRLKRSFQFAKSLGFTESEREDKSISLKLSGRGRKWLSISLEEQYASFYQSFSHSQATSGFKDYFGGSDEFDEDEENEFDDEDSLPLTYRNDPYGDSLFYGVSLSLHQQMGSQSRYFSYYTPMAPQVRQALRSSVRKAFESLAIGVYYEWDSVLNHLASLKTNPLVLNGDASKLVFHIDQKQVPRLPEPMLQAARFVLRAFLIQRLIPFDAFRPAINAEGKLCVARLPRFSGYFGLPYDSGKDETSATTRVIVQPDFSVLVIGLDPAPAVDLAPFCERAGGHAGQGALTFRMTRDSVVRAVMQGLNAQIIVARLTKHASIEVPSNVINEVKEWAGWVRQVNVRPVTVIRCPDTLTVARVLAVLGKKAERLSETLVALQTPTLASAERQKLQDQGILISKKEISITRINPPDLTSPPASTVVSPKRRGRPKKAR